MRTLWWIGCAVGCGIGCAAAPEPPVHRVIEGVDEVSQPLSDLSAQCTFTPSTRVLALSLNAGDIAVITRATNATITINDQGCGGATVATTHRIDVREGTVGNQTVIFDLGGGLFAAGATGAPGATIDLGGQAADSVKLIGSPGVDSVVIGTGGIAINPDAFADLTVANTPLLVVSLDDGDDAFSGAGNTASGAAFATTVTVYGGNGNDTLRGGNGNDVLNGGAGSDTFTTGAAADGNDALHGGSESDTADYSARIAAVNLSINGTADDGALGETDDIGSDVETVKGGQGDDTLTGGATNDTIYGGPGNDTIAGGGGGDALYGDAGNDTFDESTAANGGDIMNGGAGSDTVTYGGRGNPVSVTLDAFPNDGELGELDKVMLDVENVTGGGDDDMLTGSAFDNVLVGGAGDDMISGGLGNDTLRGGAGDDTLNGDLGADTFDEAADTGNDTLNGGAGVDLVDYHGRSADLVVMMDGTTASGASGEADHVATDVENLIGGSGADTLTGNAADNQLEGGPGTAIDTLYGLGGDDILDGGGGTDVLDCGPGDADVNLDQTTSGPTGCES